VGELRIPAGYWQCYVGELRIPAGYWQCFVGELRIPAGYWQCFPGLNLQSFPVIPEVWDKVCPVIGV